MNVAMTSMASSFELPESSFFFSSFSGLGICSKSYCLVLLGGPKLAPTKPCRLRRLKTLRPGRAGCIFGPRQNPGTVSGDGDRVLEVSGRLTVGRFSDPFVAHVNVRLAGVHHRLDGDDHAFLQARTATGLAIVRKVGLVMHPGADAVPDKFTNHR